MNKTFSTRKLLRCALALSLLQALTHAQAESQTPASLGSGYRLQSTLRLPSSNTGWDYLAIDPSRQRLFIARRADGLGVVDLVNGQLLRTLDKSVGANGPLLVPKLGRGYVANTDGTVTIFDLASLNTLARVTVDAGDLNALVFEPTTQRVIAITGARQSVSTLIVLDPHSGATISRHDFESAKLDTPAVDGKGLLYLPARDRKQLLKLSADSFKVLATWDLPGCEAPVAVELDTHRQRLLIGCRGDRPVLQVLDARDGQQLASLPIGRGVDGLVHDATHRLIFTSGGGDASLSVIRETADGGYMPLETIATRPMARTMAFDPTTRSLFLVTADFTTPAVAPGNAATPQFHPDSFTVLSYAPR